MYPFMMGEIDVVYSVWVNYDPFTSQNSVYWLRSVNCEEIMMITTTDLYADPLRQIPLYVLFSFRFEAWSNINCQASDFESLLKYYEIIRNRTSIGIIQLCPSLVWMDKLCNCGSMFVLPTEFTAPACN